MGHLGAAATLKGIFLFDFASCSGKGGKEDILQMLLYYPVYARLTVALNQYVVLLFARNNNSHFVPLALARGEFLIPTANADEGKSRVVVRSTASYVLQKRASFFQGYSPPSPSLLIPMQALRICGTLNFMDE